MKAPSPGADDRQDGAGAADTHHELASIKRLDSDRLSGLLVNLGLRATMRKHVIDPIGGYCPQREAEQCPHHLRGHCRGRRQVDLQ